MATAGPLSLSNCQLRPFLAISAPRKPIKSPVNRARFAPQIGPTKFLVRHTNWLQDAGVIDRAKGIRHEYLTGTAIAIIVVLLILLVRLGGDLLRSRLRGRPRVCIKRVGFGARHKEHAQHAYLRLLPVTTVVISNSGYFKTLRNRAGYRS